MPPRSRALLTVTPLALLSTLAPSRADACQPIPFDVEFLLPRPTAGPLDGVLFALVDAPGGDLEAMVTLMTGDGVELPVEVTVERDGAHEHALVRARPLALLEPQTNYVWSVGYPEFALAFTTGDSPDLVAPSVGELVASYAGERVVYGCFGEANPITEYDITVTELDEPVVLYAKHTEYGSVYAAWDMPLRVIASDDCFDVFVEDPGGHTVELGSTCVGGDGDGDGDGTGTGDETSGGPDDETSGSNSDTTGSEPELDDDEPGCGCQAGPLEPRDAAPLSLLLGLVLVRRRSH